MFSMFYHVSMFDSCLSPSRTPAQVRTWAAQVDPKYVLLGLLVLVLVLGLFLGLLGLGFRVFRV